MRFAQKHKPACFDDLVFADQEACEVLREYALGLRKRSLLIYGPCGAGKTSVGSMILAHRMPSYQSLGITAYLDAYLDNSRSDWSNIREVLSSMPGDHGCLQIDNVHDYKKVLLNQLDAILETDVFGTLILTADTIENIEGWVTSRCEVVQLLLPTADQYGPRALAILEAEGVPATHALVDRLLYGFHGNWYELLRLLEDYVIEQKAK